MCVHMYDITESRLVHTFSLPEVRFLLEFVLGVSKSRSSLVDFVTDFGEDTTSYIATYC